MIHYNLRCADGHSFDGWFNSSAGFDKQAKRGLLECPQCGSVKVNRALMTPSLARKGRSTAELPPSTPPFAVTLAKPAPPAVVAERVPDHIRAMLQKLRAEVEQNCDYVGPDFANEARRIASGDADARGIYGETTPDEAEALADEGIAVSSIPWVPRADG